MLKMCKEAVCTAWDPACYRPTPALWNASLCTLCSPGTVSLTDITQTNHSARLLQVNCLILLFAAHDTVASCMALLLRFLKHNPEALQKLRAEQRQVSHQDPDFVDMTKTALAFVWSPMLTQWLVLHVPVIPC